MSDNEVKDLLAKADEIEKKQEEETLPEQESNDPREQYVCPVCSHPAGQFIVQPDENDLREFMRCILGGKLYAKTYHVGSDVQKGGMQWKLQVLTQDQSEHMDSIIDKIATEEGPNERLKFGSIQETKLVFYIRKIGDKEYEPPAKTKLTPKEIHEVFQERFGEQSELLSTLGIRMVTTFEQLVAVLTTAVFDKSFWKGAGLA